MTISEKDKQLIYLELEQQHFNTSNALNVFNKATMMYFLMLIIAMFAMVNNYASKTVLNSIIVMSIAILIIGSIPYFRSISQEEKNVNKIINEIKAKK